MSCASDGCGCGHGAQTSAAQSSAPAESHAGHAHGAGSQGGTATAVQVQAPTTTGVILSEVAAAKVKSLLEQEGRDDLALRIAVQPGGCSGLRYQLFFDERSLDGDAAYDFGGVSVVVDRMSQPYLHGATIDFVDSIEKQGFTIDNPNASGSCACGDSFH
jgi:iron-sulfur cluster assembly accessory protein